MEEEDKPVWEDEEGEVSLPKKNMYQKLQLETETTEQQYEGRLKQFYNSKYGLHNWATSGEGE